MTSSAPVFLFIPVSSPEGIGEYMRSLIVARQVLEIWQDAKIHFILSEQAPYATNCPFNTFFTPKSPTKHIKEVNEIIGQVKPNIVIFDASGRKSQLQQAKRHGAKVVFISQHKKKRSKGLKLGRLKVIDSHWVAQPQFIIGNISRFEKLKLALQKKAPPIYTGAIFTPPTMEHQEKLLTRYGLVKNKYLILNAGSGGHFIDDTLAADIYAETAKYVSERHNITCLMVYGANYPHPVTSTNNVIAIKELENSEFINLVASAKAVVLSGGDTLLQAIALRKPCLATPVSKDQPARINACLEQELILASKSERQSMAAAISQLLSSEVQAQLHHKLEQSEQNNGIDTAMVEIKRLLNEPVCG